MESEKTLSLIALGDLILGDNSEEFVEPLRPVLRKADIRIGQLEVPYTERNEVFQGLSREPYRLEPLADCMDILAMSGNHLYDAKEEGVEDTISWLEAHNILHAGAGKNLEEARKAAIFVKHGVKIGLLNFNCVGPKAAWATESKMGGSYVKINTHYELGDIANPGGQPEIIETYPDLHTLTLMKRDIEALRSECDILIVYFHKGIVHKPIKLADYE